MDGKTNAQVASTIAHFRIRTDFEQSCIFWIGTIQDLFTVSSSTSNVYSGYGYGNNTQSGTLEIIVPVSEGLALMTSYPTTLCQKGNTYWIGYTNRNAKYGLLHRWEKSSPGGSSITTAYKINGCNTSGEHTGTCYLKSMFEPNVYTTSKFHVDMAGITFYFTSKYVPDGPENQVYICCDYNGSTYSNISFKDANGDACDMDGLIANGLYGGSAYSLYFIPGITKIEYYDTP